MRRCDENHFVDEGQRFEEHRARAKIARLGIELRLVKRDRRDVVPEAIPAIDDHHFRQEPALAVADHYHLVERRVLSLGIDGLAHSDERFTQTHLRQHDRIAAVIEQEPKLIARCDFGIVEQIWAHLLPSLSYRYEAHSEL